MWQLFLGFLLAPLLITQGLYTRRTTVRLPEPEGKRQGQSGSGPLLRLLIVGDSAAAGVGCDHQEQALLGQLVKLLSPHFKIEYRLEALTGDTSKDCFDKLNTLPEFKCDIVLTSLGVNDVTSGCSAGNFEQRQRQLVSLLENKFGANQIILSGLPPMGHFPALPQPLRWFLGSRATALDLRLRKMATERNLDYIEFEFDGDSSVVASDGYHPGPQVYQHWAGLAAELIKTHHDS